MPDAPDDFAHLADFSKDELAIELDARRRIAERSADLAKKDPHPMLAHCAAVDAWLYQVVKAEADRRKTP